MNVDEAANLGVGRLQQAFLAIRRALASDGEEIVLLVEDFALVQGIQRDLLDAILETSEREGRTVLLPSGLCSPSQPATTAVLLAPSGRGSSRALHFGTNSGSRSEAVRNSRQKPNSASLISWGVTSMQPGSGVRNLTNYALLMRKRSRTPVKGALCGSRAMLDSA